MKVKSEFDPSELVATLNLPKVEKPKFNGDPLQYHAFIYVFGESVDRVNCSDSFKLTRLLQYTTGMARQSIASCVMLPVQGGYRKALKILEDRFGNEHLIAERFLGNIQSGKSMRSPDDIVKLADELNSCEVMLCRLGKMAELDTQSAILKIVRRLPADIIERWRRRAVASRLKSFTYPSFHEFAEFV